MTDRTGAGSPNASPSVIMTAMASRGVLAFSIAALGGMEGFILSLPLGSALAERHAPKSEFRGLAMLGSTVFTGMEVAAVVFLGLLVLIFAIYRPGFEPRCKRILATLLLAVAATIIGAIALGKMENGIVMTLWINAALLVAGLVVSFARPSPICSAPSIPTGCGQTSSRAPDSRP